MKTIIISLLMLFVLNTIIAQTPANIGGIEAPQEIKDKFAKNHPSVVANWSRDGENYKATYEDPMSHKGSLIIYSKKGEVIRTENEVDNLTYPKNIHEYYTKNYPNEEFKTWSIQDHTGVNYYYINRNNEVIRFDKDGNYIPNKEK